MNAIRIITACLIGLILLTAGPVGAQDGRQPPPEDENRKIGVHYTKDADGNEVVIYTTGKPERGRNSRRTDEDRQKSWRMLDSIIIDTRRNSK